MTAAERTEQRVDALQVANAIRLANAKLKREIEVLPRQEGSTRVADLLEAPSGPVGSVPIGRMLMWVNGIGEYGMGRLLRHAQILSATKRVRTLTPRQRKALAVALRDRSMLWPYTQDFAA